MCFTLISKYRLYLLNFQIDFVPAMTVYHGEQIVAPYWQVTRALVTVADEVELTDDVAQFDHCIIFDIPYGHAIGL